MAEIIIIDPIGGLTSTKRDGVSNDSQGLCSTTFGGRQNDIAFGGLSPSVLGSTILGGQKNTINSPSCYSTIFGGQCNTVQQTRSSIGGGCDNKIINQNLEGSVIGGGYINKIESGYSVIGGGNRSCTNINGNFSTVFGGRHNMNFSSGSTVVGGWYNWNCNNTQNSTISGGYDNCNRNPFSTIGGGQGNTSNSTYGTIGGGLDNCLNSLGVTSTGSTILGGESNQTFCKNSTIIGGTLNQVRENSSVGGGYCNRISGTDSVIGGGKNNLILNSNFETILGGSNNRICKITSTQTSGSTILGGINNEISNAFDSGIAGSNNIANGSCVFALSTDSNVFGFRNVVLGGQGITTIGNDTVFVPFLNINDLGITPAINNLGVDANGLVVPGTNPNSPNLIAARGKEEPIYPIINNAATLAFSNIFEGTVMVNSQAYDDWETSAIADTYDYSTGIWTCPETALYNISYFVQLTQCEQITTGVGPVKYANIIIPPVLPCSNEGLGWGVENFYTNTGYTCVCPSGYELTPDGQSCIQVNVLPFTGTSVVPLSIQQFTEDAWGAFGVRVFKPNSWFLQNGQPLSGVNYTQLGPNYGISVGVPNGGTQCNPAIIHNFCTPNEGNYPNGCSYDYYVFCGWSLDNIDFPDSYFCNGTSVPFTNPCESNGSKRFWRNRMKDINVWKLNDPNWVGTLCVCDTIDVPVSKMYYIGIGGDNNYSIQINGVPFVSFVGDETGSSQANFKWWNVYPVFLNAGPNTIYMCNENLGAAGGLATEIYDMTLAQLTAATSVSDLNILYSTSEYHPGGPREGSTSCPTNGCPSGYEYVETDNGPICMEILYTSCTQTITGTSTSSIGMISAGITDPSNTILYVGSHTTPAVFQKEAYLSGGQVHVLLNQGDQLCLRVNNTTGIPYSYNNGTTDYTSMTIQRVKEVPPSPTPTPTQTSTPTPTPTPTVTPTPSLPSDCGISGYSYDPAQFPTPTPSTTASVAQFGCVGLFGDAVTDEYFNFGGIRNGKPFYVSNEITFNLNSCGGQQTIPPMTVYWDSGASAWFMEITSSGIDCATLIGSPDSNFPVATGSTNWSSFNTSNGCPCTQFYNLIDTFAFNPCAYRFRLASGSTYNSIQTLCGSQYFFVSNPNLTYPFAYTPNPVGSNLVDTIQLGTNWYSDSTFTTSLGDGFYMIPTIVISGTFTRYWFELQSGVVVQSGLC
jgi:hypothetical protein